MASNFSEIGKSGLNHWAGYVQEEYLRELKPPRWQKNVREMLNDPVVCAGFLAIEMLTRQVTWDIQPGSDAREDEEIADFVRGCLFEDMSQPWTETVAEAHSYLPWGWAYLELVYKRRQGESNDPSKNSKFNDNKIGWRKWPIRAQESLDRWEFDETGGIQAMIQRPAPDYREIRIPIDKALLFRTSAHKNNPEGRAMCRPIFRPFYFKQRIENFEGIGIERDLAGIPVATIPSHYMATDAPQNLKDIYEEVKNIVTNVKNNEQGGVVFPSDRDEHGNPEFEFKLLSAAGQKQFDTNKIIQRKNLEILLTLMADFLVLGHEKVGSFALSSDKTNMFSTAIGAFLDSDCEVVNRHAIPRLLRLNGMPTANLPKLTHGDIESVNLTELGEFISKLSGTGVRLTAEQLAYIEKQAGLPVPEDVEELEELIGPKPEPFKAEKPSSNGKRVVEEEEKV